MKEVRLFYSQFCPFCQESKNYIIDNNLNIELVDATSDSKNKEELLEIGGKMQVPMLSINNEALYESKDIIKWIKENEDELKK